MALVGDIDEEESEPYPDDNEGQTGEYASEDRGLLVRSQGRSG